MRKGKIKLLILLTLVAVGAGFLLYRHYFFQDDRIKPGRIPEAPKPVAAPDRTGRVELVQAPEVYEAVGTIRPKTETRISSQVTGQVLEIMVRSGEEVRPGQPLVLLDGRGFRARLEQAQEGLNSARAMLEQAKQGVAAAKAVFDRTELDYERSSRLIKSRTISPQEFDRAKAAYLAAEADYRRAQEGRAAAESGVKRAEKQLEEAKIGLTYTKINAMESGQVVERLVEPGDMAYPGKPLLVLQTGRSLLLEALVREGLIGKARPGAKLQVVIDSLGRSLPGSVEEVVPSADPATRTFLVKVSVNAVPGLYPGMFGRLQIPVENRDFLVVPVGAVRRIGQLELVRVKHQDRWRDQFVRTGAMIEDRIEVFSGLDQGDVVGLWEN